MATVPSGWIYYDKSADKYLEAGATMPTPATGDMYYSSGNNTMPAYTYYAQYSYYYKKYDPNNDRYKVVTVPAGWEAHSYAGYTGTSFAPLSSIAGKPVIVIDLYNEKTIKTITAHTNLKILVADSFPNITTVNGSVGSNLLYCYFGDCSKLTSVPSLSNATSVIMGRYIFSGCTALTSVTALPPNIEDIRGCFKNCTSLTSAPTIPTKVLYAGEIFTNCTSLITAPTNNSTILQMIWGGFDGCTKLQNASAFTFYPSITEMQYCFRNCTSLTTPPAVITGTNAVAYRLFENCTSLVTPPSFEGTYTNMNTLFWKCDSLETAPVIPNGSQTMSWAFAECTSLEEIPYIPSTVNILYYCFYKCTSLTWVSMRLNNVNGCSYNYMFAGCTNLTGVIYLGNTYVPPCNHMFYDTTKTIIIGGTETCVNAVVAQQNNNNVYRWLSTNYTNIASVRTDINGTPDDAGEYMQLSIDFTCPVVDYSKLYVPKVYIKNNQIAPLQNWVLTYINEQEVKIVKEIENSTDIEAARIEANDVIASGNFTTIFSANSLSEGAALTIYIPTSNSQVATDWDNSNHQYVIGTVYWNGTSGSAIFTGETFIFDALPDGTAFKIGGPVYEDETGFIVGNANSTPYPSTFNGPATFNDNIYININENASTGTVDGDLYNIIVDVLHWNDILN